MNAKQIIATTLLLLGATATYAQNASSSATQTAKLSLTDAIEITFVSTGTRTGNDVNLTFSTVNDYANGVESGAQQLRVRSNRKCDISMEASSDYFTYTGSTTPTPRMEVKDVLDLMISENNTGGQINGGYHQYKHIDGNRDTRILNDCDHGDKTFSVKYKAAPGFEFPAGTYTVNMLYTATHD